MLLLHRNDLKGSGHFRHLIKLLDLRSQEGWQAVATINFLTAQISEVEWMKETKRARLAKPRPIICSLKVLN